MADLATDPRMLVSRMPKVVLKLIMEETTPLLLLPATSAM